MHLHGLLWPPSRLQMLSPSLSHNVHFLDKSTFPFIQPKNHHLTTSIGHVVSFFHEWCYPISNTRKTYTTSFLSLQVTPLRPSPFHQWRCLFHLLHLPLPHVLQLGKTIFLGLINLRLYLYLLLVLPHAPHLTIAWSLALRLGFTNPIPSMLIFILFLTFCKKIGRSTLQDLEWHIAMQDEIQVLHDNNMWNLVPRITSIDVIHCKWVFKT